MDQDPDPDPDLLVRGRDTDPHQNDTDPQHWCVAFELPTKTADSMKPELIAVYKWPLDASRKVGLIAPPCKHLFY